MSHVKFEAGTLVQITVSYLRNLPQWTVCHVYEAGKTLGGYVERDGRRDFVTQYSAKPFQIGVNIWDDSVYGDATPVDHDESVTRWTVYEDNPEVGYLTDMIIDSGTLTFTGDPEVDQFLGSDDDWIDSSQAVDFSLAVKAAERASLEGDETPKEDTIMP